MLTIKENHKKSAIVPEQEPLEAEWKFRNFLEDLELGKMHKLSIQCRK
jgi:hypothetical protein